MKKVVSARTAVQILYLVLVCLGLNRYLHPYLLILIPLALLAGNYFCGWLCPVGATQELMGRIGSLFVKKKMKPSLALQRYAQYSKYLFLSCLLLLVALGAIQPADAETLPVNAYKTFFIFAATRRFLSISAGAFFVFILALSMFTERPFCNYLCATGVRYALPSWTRLFTIKRNAAACVQCKLCDKICPMHIQVSSTEEIRNLQCINCFKCTASCPVHGALSYGKANILRRFLNNTYCGISLLKKKRGKISSV